jgi:hypothetical protein
MHVSLLTLTIFLAAADDAKTVRYGITPDIAAFPQKSPQETLASVIKAAEAKHFDYLAAQLADPVFIDERVRRIYGGNFGEQVEDTRGALSGSTLGQLRSFLNGGAWQVDKEHAVVTLKDVADRSVSFRESGGRWFMEHRKN